MARAKVEETEGTLNRKALHTVNQILKNYGAYSYCAENRVFYGRDQGYQFLYRSSLTDDEETYSIFNHSFHVANGKILFGFINSVKSIEFEDMKLIADDSSVLQLERVPYELNEQNYTILSHLTSELPVDLNVDGSGKLYYNENLISSGPYNSNDICDAIKDASKKNGHMFAFMQAHEDRLILVNTKTKIDQAIPFVLLDTHIFKKIKLLKKDEPYFDLTFINNYCTCLITYGTTTDYVTFALNGIFKI